MPVELNCGAWFVRQVGRRIGQGGDQWRWQEPDVDQVAAGAARAAPAQNHQPRSKTQGGLPLTRHTLTD